MFRPLTLLLTCACLSVARAGDDEVHFKAKNYSPRSALQDRSFSGTAYSPSSASQPIGTRIEPAKSGRWTPFSSKATPLADKKASGSPADKGEAYKQQQHISVPTITADPSIVPAEKPFTDGGKKLTDANYKAPEGPRDKNPILKPHQSIKETE